MVTPSEVIDQVPPVGKVYLPEGSYREMSEWVLPPQQLAALEEARKELESDPRWPKISRFVRGGFWRNFKVRYPETNEMYCRMMAVSRRLQSMIDAGADEELLTCGRSELYRGQCNCPYWHGAFGGVYLPHLRNAIYNHLIAADNLLDRLERQNQPGANASSTSSGGKSRTSSNGAAGRSAGAGWIEAAGDDYDFDGRPEVQLASDRLIAWLAPAAADKSTSSTSDRFATTHAATLSRRSDLSSPRESWTTRHEQRDRREFARNIQTARAGKSFAVRRISAQKLARPLVRRQPSRSTPWWRLQWNVVIFSACRSKPSYVAIRAGSRCSSHVRKRLGCAAENHQRVIAATASGETLSSYQWSSKLCADMRRTANDFPAPGCLNG